MTNGTRRGWGVSVTPRPLFTPEKYPVPIVQEARWAPGPVWTGEENLAPTGILFPDRSILIQSLCRLRYPAHTPTQYAPKINLSLHSTTQARTFNCILEWLSKLTHAWEPLKGNLVVLALRLKLAVTPSGGLWWPFAPLLHKCFDACPRGHGDTPLWVSSIKVHIRILWTWKQELGQWSD
jgi:hypothetical protein